MEDIVLKLIDESKDSFVQKIKARYAEFYNKINEEYVGKSFSEKIYRWLNKENLNVGKCKKCGNPTKFLNIRDGFRKYCNTVCSNIASAPIRSEKMTHKEKDLKVWEEKPCKKCGKMFWSYIKRKGLFCSNLCNTKATANDPMRIERIKETKFNKYGNSSYVNLEKAKKTCLKKFGVENVFLLKKTQDGIKRTRIEKYINYLKTSDRLKGLVYPLFSSDDYTTGHRHNLYSFKCKKCGDVFQDNIDDGRIPRCKKCFPLDSTSIFEYEVQEFVKLIMFDEVVYTNHRSLIPPFEVDIFIPDKRVAIECDGLFWHSQVSGNKKYNYHLKKTLSGEEKNVRMIHIFEDEWLYRKHIVTSRLQHLLGFDSKLRFYARDCRVETISNTISKNFLDANHLQGNVNAPICLGLYNNQELVSIMTFGHPRLSLGHKNKVEEYELLRFCCKNNFSIIGGASKLFSHFVKGFSPKKVTTFSDLRWGRGKVYEKMDFLYVGDTPPNYWYFKPGHAERYHRFGFRKNVLQKKLKTFDFNLTEWENMQRNGYDRIWDCGNAKYVWTKK